MFFLLLDIAVEDDRISPYMYRNRLTTLEDAINDLNAFRKLTQSSSKHSRSGPRYPDMDISTIDIVPLQFMT